MPIQNLSNNCNFAMKILSYIFLGFCSLPFLALIGICCNGGETPPIAQCNDGVLKCIGISFFSGLGISAALAFLIDIILCIIIFVCIINLKSIFNFNGSDEFTNELIKILNEEASKNFTYSLAITIMFGLIIILGIISLINYLLGYFID